ncbi:MAG: alcohol dehydrogenase catalytic domain-containing protein [Kiloniellaceae bacterium]|nr:alcohol dehydrogenase catalytic domain-containing protein [Kiloniellaceae bacterium]
MKALVYTGPGELDYREVADPVAEAGEALLQVEACCICGSDMHAFHGKDARRQPPLILGHEAVGTVIGGAQAGQRVVINPLVSCGRCAACREGRGNLCGRRQMMSMNRPGSFAERVTAPEANMLEVPASLTSVEAALTEPAATAWHGVTVAARALHRPLAEARALVIGGGAIGLLAALTLRAFGCAGVRVAETNALRRDTVAAEGFAAFDPRDDDPGEAVAELVMDAVGTAATRAADSRWVRPGGVILHIGLGDNEGGLDIRKATLQEVTFIGTYTYTMPDFQSALAALAERRLGRLGWVERRPLAAGLGAFRDLDGGRVAAAKIALEPGR